MGMSFLNSNLWPRTPILWLTVENELGLCCWQENVKKRNLFENNMCCCQKNRRKKSVVKEGAVTVVALHIWLCSVCSVIQKPAFSKDDLLPMDLGTFYREFQNPPQLASLTIDVSSQSMAEDLVRWDTLLTSKERWFLFCCQVGGLESPCVWSGPVGI